MNGYRYRFNGHGYQLVRIVSRLLGVGFEPVFYEERVDFLTDQNTVLICLIDEPDSLHTVFYKAIPKFEGVSVELVDEGSGMSHQWHFRGDKIEELVLLIEIALANYKKEMNI